MTQGTPKKCVGCFEVMSCPEIANTLKKLERYEELERQGRLIELPCQIGSRVYIPIILENRIYMGIVRSFLYIDHKDFRAKISVGCDVVYEKTSDFGITVFFTYEEAKKALEGAG